MPTSKPILLLLASGLALAACAMTPHSLSAARLFGDWTVEDIAERGVIDYSPASLSFGPDGQLSGHGTCNRLASRWSATGRRITIEAPGLTRKLCPPALMDQERRYVDLLGRVTRYYVDETGALVLEGSGGETIRLRKDS